MKFMSALKSKLVFLILHIGDKSVNRKCEIAQGLFFLIAPRHFARQFAGGIAQTLRQNQR
jgi:hypothetical protein